MKIDTIYERKKKNRVIGVENHLEIRS